MRTVLRLIVAISVLGAFGALLGLVLGVFQDFHPAMDSFSHFRLHFAAVLAVCAGLLVMMKRGAVRWTALIASALSLGWITLEAQKGPPREAAAGDLRVVQFNLNFANRALGRVGDALTAFDADVVTLQEVTRAHEATLRAVAAYPHQTHCFFRNRVGAVSILSKYRLSSIQCAEGEGLVTAKINVPEGAITVGSLHTYWPWPMNQHAQVDRWVPKLRQLQGPTIVAGDFNAAPWSHAVAKVAEASRASVVPGLRMTIDLKLFPRIPAVPIPIDHVLLSDELCALAAAVGPEIGSDHYPVIVEIGRVDLTASTGCSEL